MPVPWGLSGVSATAPGETSKAVGAASRIGLANTEQCATCHGKTGNGDGPLFIQNLTVRSTAVSATVTVTRPASVMYAAGMSSF